MSSVESVKNKKARLIVDMLGRSVTTYLRSVASESTGILNFRDGLDSSRALDVRTDIVATLPNYYGRSSLFSSSGSVLVVPAYVAVNVANKGYILVNADSIDLDELGAPYNNPVNRAGKDFYLIADVANSVDKNFELKIVCADENPSIVNTERLIGGFHCECADVGAIAGSGVSGLEQGDIIPMSIWDLKHRPVSSPVGMTYSEALDLWVDLYYNSWNLVNNCLVSAFGVAPATNYSAQHLTGEKANELLAAVGKRLPTRDEFVVFSQGSNVGTGIDGVASDAPSEHSVDLTGAHVDSSGVRMVSSCGVEDCCGWLLQPTSTTLEYRPYGDISGSELGYGDSCSSDSVYNSTADSAVLGASDGFVRRACVGGCPELSFMEASDCGPRAVVTRFSASWLDTSKALLACRGVSPSAKVNI